MGAKGGGIMPICGGPRSEVRVYNKIVCTTISTSVRADAQKYHLLFLWGTNNIWLSQKDAKSSLFDRNFHLLELE